MDEISNKTLAILLVGAIVISLGGTLISLNKLGKVRTVTITGLAPGDVNRTEGNVSLTISDITWINFSVATCNFGAGYVRQNTCTLNSSGYEDIGNGCSPEWATSNVCTVPLEIRNIGNNNVSLNISWQSNDSFIQPSGAMLWFKMLNGTAFAGTPTAGCRGQDAQMLKFFNKWERVYRDNQHNVTCSQFYFGGGQNIVSMHIEVNFTQAAMAGAKENIITAYGKVPAP